MTDNTPFADMAAAIVNAHRALGQGFAPQPQPQPADQANDPVYRAALQAASELGFVAVDALVIAQAWAAQTRRVGAFDPASWPTDRRDFGLAAESVVPAFPPCPSTLGLYAVLPDAAWVGRMARAGVPTVQLRFKSDDTAAIAHEVQAAVNAVQGTNALLFINDHWQAALAAGAYGVHLGQEDLDALAPGALEQVRQAGARLGLSTHGYSEMLRAMRAAPSYLALGAVFPTQLKQMATAPQGVARLRQYVALMQGAVPLVAIGGIDAPRMAEVAATGVGSVAVVRALVAATDPEAAVRNLMARMQSAIGGATG